MRLRPVFAVLLIPLLGWAQPEAPSAGQATVTFRFDWKEGIPWQQYSITVQSDGRTRFDGIPAAEEGNTDTDPFQQDFTMSEANQQMIFELAKKLNDFRGDYDSHLKKIAQTGNKTLEYRSGTVQGSTSYNYSQNADVQRLTHLFQSIATTVDYGRKLAFQYRFDKLGMDQRLKELVELQERHDVHELASIEPILRKIANDPNMMHISRQSAQQLLKSITGTTMATQTPAQP